MALNRETKSTILIVEDDEGIAELEKIQLERANYAVAMATTVDEAMAQLRKQPIDLILLDYRLPGDVHGLDFFREMKAAGFDPPVIMVTGFSNESLAIQALRAGVRDLITKSTEYLDYLPEAVDRVMGQVRMERKLAESEARLTSIIDSNKDAIIISESKHRITLFNKSAESMFRCPAGQALGQPIGRFVQRHSRETPHSEEQSAAESLTHLLHEGNVGIRPDGTEFPVELSLSRVNVAGRQFHTLIVRDITRRRQSEEALRESDRFARSTLDGLSAHIAIVDETGVIVAINQSWKAFADANGPVAGNVCEGSNYLDVCDRSVGAKSEEASPVAAGIRMVLEKAIPRFTAEYPCHSPTEKRWFTVSVTPFPGDGPRRAVIAHENITARKLAENALLISEEHLRTVTDNATTAIFMEDGSARCTFMNPAAEAMTGLSFDEVKGRILHDVIHHPWPDDRPLPLADCPIHDSMSKLKRLFRHEDTFFKKDRSSFPVECNASPLTTGGVLSGVILEVRDVSAQKSLEAQLHQSQKMEAFGQLAGGVAHDFNNLLTIIMGYSEMILSQMTKDDPKREMVADIHHAGDRAATLTRQLLAFSRKQVLEPKIVELNGAVGSVEKMLRRLIGEDIVVTCVLRPVAKVKVDPGQLEQVILNLAVNARDAMPRGGRLTIETAEIQWAEDDPSRVPECPAGKYVLLSIADTGSGMTPEIRTRIFEPFFTTKGVGKGTGLGLATVFGIVKQSEGHILVDSELGQGTTFKIYFPAAEQANEGAETESKGQARGGHERVLIVEDEAPVRQLAKISLERFGYRVLEAASGAAAIAAFEAIGGEIDLLMSDVVMPAMSGRELAEILCQRKPGLRVLFVSGYNDDAIVRHGVVQSERAFLQKPYSYLDLAKKVRELLDGAT